MAKKKQTTAIGEQLPPVDIEYDGRKGRETKHFEDAYEARRFYVAKDKAGKNPKVKKGQLEGLDSSNEQTSATEQSPAENTKRRHKPAAVATGTTAGAVAQIAEPTPASAETAPTAADNTVTAATVVTQVPGTPARPKIPGVAWVRTRSFVAAQIVKRHGLEAGVTDEMVAELDSEYGKPNPVQSRFDLQGAWHCIRAYVGFERE